mgnify:CR=1 FL=1
MNKSILFFAVISLISFHSFGQTVKDYKVPFQYIQLPLKPFVEDVSTYTVVIINDFQQANEDTLKAYDARLAIAKKEQENLLEMWNNDRLRIDRIYLSEMSVWEKAVNLGNNTLAEPVKNPYPEYPFLKEVSLPILTENISAEFCSQKINLAGYQKLVSMNITEEDFEAAVIITITHQGLQASKISKKITGSGAQKKYKYTAHFKMPVDVKIEAPTQGLVYTKTYYSNETSELIRDDKSQYDYQLWWIDNKDKYWKGLQTRFFNNILNDLNNHINSTYGYPVKSNQNEIYVIKKYKKHSYSEFIDAMTYAKIGYKDFVNDVDKVNAKENIYKAIKIWEKQLEQSNLIDNKSRINKKATALLCANLAEAYLWIDQYEKADLYINKAITIGVLKYKNHCKRLQDKMGNLNLRYQAKN